MPISRSVTTRIDTDRCNGCGRCIPVCPAGTISLKNNKAEVSGSQSLSCDHCAAACPQKAVQVAAICPEASNFQTFSDDNRWLPFGQFDISSLVRLMRSRRSCRNYSAQPIDRRQLEDLIKIGATAPSGTNCQPWAFTLLPSRQEVLRLGNRIAAFFQRLNRLAGNTFLRRFLKLLGNKTLDRYYHEFYESVAEGLSQWQQNGLDLLFHGAPAVIVVSARPGASCPQEDALLATQNILLAAHCLGLGTCLIGFAVEAMKRDRSIQHAISIPADETVYAVIALGHPAESYCRVAGRKPVVFRYSDGKTR